MHFLAHLLLNPYKENPWNSFGVALPDMHRRFSRIYNSKNFKSFSPTETILFDLHSGVNFHYKQDHAFHNLTLFEDWMKLFTAEYRKLCPNESELKLFFIEHIAVEFLLDHWIFKSNPELADLFYRNLEQINKTTVELYYQSINVPDLAPQLLTRLDWFLNNRFIYYFSDLERIMEGICRIYEHSTSEKIAEDKREKLLQVFENLSPQFGMVYETLILETGNSLNGIK